jgi:diadenosine tetraphosphate (Ap4A) HIT family hydrolase
MFNNPFIHGFVAEVGDNITGYIRLFFNNDENRLYAPSLYILPGFQGKNIGRQLLEAAEGYATQKLADKLWIGVMVNNTQALDFYRKVGFLFIEEKPFTMGKTTVSHLIGYKKIGRKVFLIEKTYATPDRRENLPDLCLNLLEDQKKEWLDLREGYKLLKAVKERDLSCKGFSIRLQYNPRRIKSSLANVNKEDSRERRCFLCLDHLPENQKGILYRNDFLILCNPMPVFSSHFIVSHLDHRTQAIEEHFDSFLQLITDFGPKWTILYNGPKCGASAPDHLHFHVVPSGQMPIEKEIRQKKRLSLIVQIDGVLFYRVKDIGREVILLVGNDPMVMGGAFKRLMNNLKKVLMTEEEPMINIAGFFNTEKWSLVIFPRKKHRPDAFFREGDRRIVVSPGAIDMGGIVITPVKKDFERLDALIVEDINKEVSIDGETLERVIEAMA